MSNPKLRGMPRNLPPMAAAGPTGQVKLSSFSSGTLYSTHRGSTHLHHPCDVKRCSLDMHINRALQRSPLPFHPVPPLARLPLPSFTMTIFEPAEASLVPSPDTSPSSQLTVHPTLPPTLINLFPTTCRPKPTRYHPNSATSPYLSVTLTLSAVPPSHTINTQTLLLV